MKTFRQACEKHWPTSLIFCVVLLIPRVRVADGPASTNSLSAAILTPYPLQFSDIFSKGGCVPQALCETAKALDADETYPALVL